MKIELLLYEQDVRKNIRLGNRHPRVHYKMSRSTPKMRDIAKRLIACETKENISSKTKFSAILPVQEKLRPHLAIVMGKSGFRSLQMRALHLATAEVDGLRAVHVNADGTLGGLDELAAQSSPENFIEARVVLLAQLLGLLVTFIGPVLTQRLLHDIWPAIKEMEF